MFNFVLFCHVILIVEAFLIGQKASNKKLEKIKDLKVAEYEKAPLLYSKPSLNQKVASYRKTVDSPLYQDVNLESLGEYAPLNYGNKDDESSLSGLSEFQPDVNVNVKSLTPKFANKFDESGDEVNLHGEHPLYMQPLNPFSFMHPLHAHEHDHDHDHDRDHDRDHFDFELDHGHDHDHDHDHGGHVFDWFDHADHEHYIDAPDHSLDFPEDIFGHNHDHGHGHDHHGHDHHLYRATNTKPEVKKSKHSQFNKYPIKKQQQNPKFDDASNP